MNKILFAGCSYTAGSGFALEKQEPDLWVNLLHKNNEHFNSLQLVNVSRGGRSNAGIFQDCTWHLCKDHYRFAVIAWTSMPRFEIDLGLETYETKQCFIANSATRTHHLNDITYTESYLNGIRDRWISLVHLHGEIKNLLYYVNCLVRLAKLVDTKIFFVNAMCPWDKDYFNKKKAILPRETTEFTQQTIINLENRDDEEFFLLYDKIHLDYQTAGGIQEPYWLNLYNSLRQARIDTNDDLSHPGPKSNHNYFQFLNQALQQMI